MAISKQFHNLGANTADLASGLKDAAKTTFSKDGWKAAAGAAAKPIEDKPGILMGMLKFIAAPLIWTAKIGVALVKMPVDLAMRVGNGGLEATTKFVKGNPKTAILGGTAVAVLGGAHLLAKHNAKKLEAQNDAVQQLQAVQAAQPVSYMNSASYAPVQAKMDADRANGAAAGSFTDRAAAPAAQASTGPAV